MDEKVSALSDGEMGNENASRLIADLRDDPELRRDWDTCHLIGDALRGPLSSPVASRVAERLASEPAVLAPRARAAPPRHYRRWAVSAVASAAAVALVAWMALPMFQAERQASLAQVPDAAGVQTYLLAHQRYSPSSAMQGVAPYVRLVADEPDRSGR